MAKRKITTSFLCALTIATCVVPLCYATAQGAEEPGDGCVDADDMPDNGGKARQKKYLLEELWIYLEEGAYNTRRHIYLDLGIEEEYNDNIFLSKEDKESDFVSRIYPGLRYVFKPEPVQGRTSLLTEADIHLAGEIKRYAKHGNLNRDFNLDDKSFIQFNFSAQSTFFERVNTYCRAHRSEKFASQLFPDARTSPTEREREVKTWTTSYG
ncbi:MAG: hypothetical protein ABIA77_00225, partial [Candidatus Omnitrophota bacterium]